MCVNWEQISSCRDIDTMINVWANLFLEVVNKHAPLKTHRVKKQFQPDWLSSELIDWMKERNRCKINRMFPSIK